MGKNRVKVIRIEDDYMNFQFGSYCVLMYYASQIDDAKSERMFNATCTEYEFRYYNGLDLGDIDDIDDEIGHFDIQEINEVINFIDQQLIPELEAETEDLDLKYGGLDKFIDIFYKQTNFLSEVAIDSRGYFDFSPSTVIFDLVNFKRLLLSALSLNKAPRIYFD